VPSRACESGSAPAGGKGGEGSDGGGKVYVQWLKFKFWQLKDGASVWDLGFMFDGSGI